MDWTRIHLSRGSGVHAGRCNAISGTPVAFAASAAEYEIRSANG